MTPKGNTILFRGRNFGGRFPRPFSKIEPAPQKQRCILASRGCALVIDFSGRFPNRARRRRRCTARILLCLCCTMKPARLGPLHQLPASLHTPLSGRKAHRAFIFLHIFLGVVFKILCAAAKPRCLRCKPTTLARTSTTLSRTKFTWDHCLFHAHTRFFGVFITSNLQFKKRCQLVVNKVECNACMCLVNIHFPRRLHTSAPFITLVLGYYEQLSKNSHSFIQSLFSQRLAPAAAAADAAGGAAAPGLSQCLYLRLRLCRAGACAPGTSRRPTRYRARGWQARGRERPRAFLGRGARRRFSARSDAAPG